MIFRTISLFLLIAALSLNPLAFSAQLNFTPRSSVEVEYTDNVFLDDNNTEDDFITTLSAGFTAQLLGRTNGLEVSFDPGYVFYEDFTGNDGWRLPATLRAWTNLTRSTLLEFNNYFIRTEDPVAQERITAEGGRVEETGDTTARSSRDAYYRNRARLNLSHQFGREDRVYTEFLYGLLRNDDNQVEDNDEYRASAGLDYWFTQKYGSEYYGEFTRGEFSGQSGFDGEPTSDFDNWLGTLRFLGRMTRHFSLFIEYNQAYRNFDSDGESDYIVYAPSAGFTYSTTEDMYLRLGLGCYWRDFKDDDNQEDAFIEGEISKTWNFQRGFINLLGLSGLTQNDFGAESVGFQQFASIQGTANYDFTRQIVGDMGAYYRYAHTPSQERGGENVDELDTNDYQFTAGIGYEPTLWMTIRLGYEFNKYTSSSGSSSDYNENRGLLTITLEPDQPWRF